MKLPWFAFVLASLGVASAYAQNTDYPNRPIKVVVPFTAGAGSDTSARFFGEQLSAKLGQPVLVENRPGASGAIGITTVKNAPADGYTILLASNSPMTVNPVMMKNLPYDPIKELKPVYGLIRNANVFIVPPGSRIQTLSDLVAAARERPLNAGTAASGYHIVLEWFANAAGVKFNNVPYKGGGSCLQRRGKWADRLGCGRAGRKRTVTEIGAGPGTSDSRRK